MAVTVPLSNLTDTWNAGGTVFTAIKMNVTNTASAAGSKLIDLQIGGNSLLNVDNQGIYFRSSGNANYGIIGNAGLSDQDIFFGSNSGTSFISHYAYIRHSGNFGGSDFVLSSNIAFGFSNGNADGGTFDTSLFRDASGILAQRNGTAAQGFRLYNTYTDASNYERLSFSWSSNIAVIAQESAGTGTSRLIRFDVGTNDASSSRVMFNSTTLANVGFNIAETGTKKWTFGSYNDGVSANRSFFLYNESMPGFAFAVVGDTNVFKINAFLNWVGQGRITSDVSFTSTTTLGALATLSAALLAGRTYAFEAELPFTCSSAGGARAAIVATGGLTATNIIYDGWIVDSAANGIKGNVQSTALGTVVGGVAITGTTGHISIRGTITVNVAGTLNVQGAQGVSSGTATIFKQGGYLLVHDIA